MLIKTEFGQNKYWYSPINKQFIILHPLLEYIKNITNTVLNIEEFISNLKEEIDLPNIGLVSKNDVLLSYEKYLLLRENNYFSENLIENNLKGRLSNELVKQTFANTSCVVFEVTDKCNLACTYCCYGDLYKNNSNRNYNNLNLDKAIFFLDYLLELRSKDTKYNTEDYLQIGFYGGEPLLNITFIDGIVNYLKTKNEYKIKFVLSLTTNGVLLDKYMDYLVESNIHFSVSLDGSKENNSYRVKKNHKSSFDIVFKNLKKFQMKYPLYFEKHVKILSVLHNKNSIKEISAFINQEFNKNPEISEIVSIGVNVDKTEDFFTIYKNTLEDLYQKEIYLESEKQNILGFVNRTTVAKAINQYCSFVFKDYQQLMFGNDISSKSMPTGTCLPFYYKTFVTSKGHILPCEKIDQKFALGYIGIDNKINLDFDKIAKIYNDIYDKTEKQCTSCYIASTCDQCAFNIKDIENENPNCHGCLSFNEFSQYLSLQISYLEKYSNQYNFIMKKIIGR
jgi:uncharacterized protein